MPRTTLPRFKRAEEENIPPLEIQERDRSILKMVYDYRFITTAMVTGLLGGSERGIMRRLQKLYHHGYLDRRKLSNNDPIIYSLADRGADELMLWYGIDRGKVDWRVKNREAGGIYIHHTLMVARARFAFEQAIAARDDTELVFWQSEGDLKDEVVFDGEGERKVRSPIVPDGYFAVERNGQRAHFFLEADRSTMTNERFLNKLRGYYHFWNQGRHKEKFDISAFRVLSVTLSEQRKDNLRSVAKDVGGRLGLFWFTCENLYVNDAERILAPVWQTPRDDEYRELLAQSKQGQSGAA